MLNYRILFLLNAFLFPIFGFSQEEGLSLADSLIKEGTLLQNQRKWDISIKKYKEADAALVKGKSPVSYRGITHSLIGYAYYNKGEVSEGVKYLKKSLRFYEVDSNTIHVDYCTTSYDVAILSYFNLSQNVDTLCKYAFIAGDCAYALYGDNDAKMGRFLDLYGLCKTESKDLPEAKRALLYGYELLQDHADTFLVDFVEICGHLCTLYNRLEQQDSSVIFAKKALKYARKVYDSKDPSLARAYYTLAFALNVAGAIDSSAIYLDTAQWIHPKVCPAKTKAEFYYRGGEQNFAKQDYAMAKHYFIQSGTFLFNNKILDTLEASVWLYVAAITANDLKLKEAKPYFEKTCALFKKYYGANNFKTLQVCQMADAVAQIDMDGLTLETLFPGTNSNNLLQMLSNLYKPNQPINVGNAYFQRLMSQTRQKPDFKILPQILEALYHKRYEEAIQKIQHLYPKIVPGYKDSLNYYDDPPTNSISLEGNTFMMLLLLKGVAYDRLGQLGKDPTMLKYALLLLGKCDTLMDNIRINATYEDVNGWGGIMNSLYEQMLITASRLFDSTQKEEYYNKALFAMEKRKVFSLLNANAGANLDALLPSNFLGREKKLEQKVLIFKQEITKIRQFTPVNQNKEKSLQDSLFRAEANLATLRSEI